MATYFEQAQAVMQVEIEAVETAHAEGSRPAHLRARFRLVQDLKLAQGVRGLRTAMAPEACGLALAPGERYWIFASRGAGETDVWVGACDGSGHIDQGFVDTASDSVASALAKLAAASVCPATTPAELAGRWRFESRLRPAPVEPAVSVVVSPNGAYTLHHRGQLPGQLPGQTQATVLDFDSQGAQWGRLWLHGVAAPVHTEWINEKLVFVRAHWHDGLRSDLLVDAEGLQFLAADSARRGADGHWAWLADECAPAPRR